MPNSAPPQTCRYWTNKVPANYLIPSGGPFGYSWTGSLSYVFMMRAVFAYFLPVWFLFLSLTSQFAYTSVNLCPSSLGLHLNSCPPNLQCRWLERAWVGAEGRGRSYVVSSFLVCRGLRLQLCQKVMLAEAIVSDSLQRHFSHFV